MIDIVSLPGVMTFKEAPLVCAIPSPGVNPATAAAPAPIMTDRRSRFRSDFVCVVICEVSIGVVVNLPGEDYLRVPAPSTKYGAFELCDLHMDCVLTGSEMKAMLICFHFWEWRESN